MDNYAMDSYGNAFAHLFDAVNGDEQEIKNAVALLVDYAGEGPVLEAGIGTGRIGIPLAGKGLTVHGIEISEKMAERLREKPGGERVRLVVGDMTEHRFGTPFSLVYIAQGGLHSLLTAAQQVQCLKNLSAQLADGGRLVVESLTLDQSRFVRNQYVEVTMMDVGYVALSAAVHEPERQIVNVQSVLLTSEGVQMFPLRYRHYSASELDAMAAQAGLVLQDRWADWERNPTFPAQTRFISVFAKRAG
ncbi:class I SAM-dependent methyltransferase [Streptomyces piniterrae]|uniref:Class I SAM-dependent methyltransferase n=1 Tax=Streptomyces piniterrae TaxID=2571125 RepID=A0A4U0MTV6_9ACTN|nr:class I SAM-dependent methyltransferase [Streptomyces piniterrae]TJZ44126.1 class I SAM-dependent methyltransferase [Streptomyces piniterrae]